MLRGLQPQRQQLQQQVLSQTLINVKKFLIIGSTIVATLAAVRWVDKDRVSSDVR